MTITVCPRMGKCRIPQCRLRHDVVPCKPCKCFVLHGELATHRRGEDHRLKCGFGKWKVDAKQPASAILPLPYPRVPEPKPSKKRTRRLARREELLAGVTARGGEAEARHLSVSGEEGLEFKSEVKAEAGVQVGIKKSLKNNASIPVIIQKTADNVSLTLVDVVVTGPGSLGFSAKASTPKKIKGKTPRTIHVSFVPAATGEWGAQLVLRFLHVSLGTSGVILEITRGLHGVATSPVDKPQQEVSQKPGDPKRTLGVRASQRHLGPNKRGTRQRHDTGRDSPKSY